MVTMGVWVEERGCHFVQEKRKMVEVEYEQLTLIQNILELERETKEISCQSISVSDYGFRFRTTIRSDFISLMPPLKIIFVSSFSPDRK